MKALIYIVLILIAAAVSIVFTTLNPGEVTLNLYFGQFTVPISIVVIVSIFCGILLGLLANMLALYSRRREIRRLRKKLEIAETEVSNLRKLPLQEH